MTRLNKKNSQIAKRTQANKIYITENIYKFTSSDVPEEEINNIREISLKPLVLSTKKEVTSEQLYLLQPLLRAIISSFFGVHVSTFSIFRINSVLKFVPLLSTGEEVYSSWDKLSYFLYHIKIESLLGLEYLSTNISIPAGTFSVFGVNFTHPKKIRKKVFLLENARQEGIYTVNLPREEIVNELRESFHLGQPLKKKYIRKGSFWTELNKNWLENAWSSVLNFSLPQANIYYSDPYSGFYFDALGQEYRFSLAAYLSGIKSFICTPVSITFPVSSLKELQKYIEKLNYYSSVMKSWRIRSAENERGTLILQKALENKYPNSTSWAKNDVIISNIQVSQEPTFTSEELEKASKDIEEGKVPSQYIAKREETKLPELINNKGKAEIEINGKIYDLDYSYEKLSPLWSPGILTPWALTRLKQNLWTSYWFK